MEPGEPVDDAGGGMGADANLAAVGRDGEDVRRAAQGGDGHPAGVGTEGYVLGRGKKHRLEQGLSFILKVHTDRAGP